MCDSKLNYIQINRNSWNNRLESHLKSDFYDLDSFKAGKCSLKTIELELLGNLKGKKVLHLQCHFGQDSISLARRGAEVTAIDLSDKAIATAKELAKEENLNINFICCNLYDLIHQDLEKEAFDIVFTSYGTIGWLPDLNAWAKTINNFLKPNGIFVFVEFHPVVWMFDDEFKTISYDYFNTEAILETESGSYADRAADIKQSYICWNHSLAEVFQSLKYNRLQVKDFNEYNYSPYACFTNCVEIEPSKYKIKSLKKDIPMVYSIVAKKQIKR